MVDQEILNYLKKNKDKYPMDKLKESLIKQGWPKKDVDEAARKFTSPARGAEAEKEEKAAPSVASENLSFKEIWSGFFSNPHGTIDSMGDKINWSFPLINIAIAMFLSIIIGMMASSSNSSAAFKSAIYGGFMAMVFLFALAGGIYLIFLAMKKSVPFGKVFNVLGILSMAFIMSVVATMFLLMAMKSSQMAGTFNLLGAMISGTGMIIASVIIVSYLSQKLGISQAKISAIYVIGALLILKIFVVMIPDIAGYFGINFGSFGASGASAAASAAVDAAQAQIQDILNSVQSGGMPF